MKKIKNWIVKVDGVWIILFCTLFLGFIVTKEGDASIKSFYTLLPMPIFLFVLQNLLQRKQENNYYNVDVYMKEYARNEVVWEAASYDSQTDFVYLCIKNTGKIDIFSVYIKVIKSDGTVGRFQIAEILGVDKDFVIRIPYSKECIKELVLTCVLLTESRTKKFNGIKSGNENITIFSNSEIFDEGKHAVYHESGFFSFEKMQRFWV